MSFQDSSPYGLRSLTECITRAILLSQPTDIPGFLSKYCSDLNSFRRSCPDDDPKLVCFQYQELWENDFLRSRKGTTQTPTDTAETSTASSRVPSQAAVDEVLKMLFADSAPSTEENVAAQGKGKKRRVRVTDKPSEEKKKPSVTSIPPRPPPRAGRQFGKKEPFPHLVVKGKGKPSPPSRDVKLKTRPVSSGRCPSLPLSKGATDDIKKLPETCKRKLKPISKLSSTHTDVSVSKSSEARKLSQPPSATVPAFTHKRVLPPIAQKPSNDGKISGVRGKDVTAKPWRESAVKREVGPKKSSGRSVARKMYEPQKAGEKPKTLSVPRPGSTKGPETQGATVSRCTTNGSQRSKTTKMSLTTPKVQGPKTSRIKPNASLERSRGPRDLWTERARLKPVVQRTDRCTEAVSRVDCAAKGTNSFTKAHASSSAHVCPHLAHPVHIIRYRRVRVIASSVDHSGSPVRSCHHH